MLIWNRDVIYMYGIATDGLIGLRLKRKYHKLLIVNVIGEDVTKISKKLLTRNLSKNTLRNCDAIICQSDFLKNKIREMGIRKKSYTIPMGPLLGRFKPKNRDRSRKLLKLPKSKKIILFVDGFIPRKGVEYLIKATKYVLDKEKEILVLLIGRGFLEDNLKKLSSELGLDEHIKFMGIKNNEDIAAYMNACDVFVLPSLNEGLPVVLCEALACGKPVVATSVAGIPELVTKDVGYLVKQKNENDLAQKIILALNKKWRKQKILKKGYEFSEDNAQKNLMKVLLHLSNRKS